MGSQSVGVNQHLSLFIALAPDRDVGDTMYRHQAWANGPHGEIGEIALVEFFRPDANFHHTTERR